jgi:hypothetical protein
MLITLDPPLPCCHLVDEPEGTDYHCCGRLTTQGVAMPAGSDSWELVPLCSEHDHIETDELLQNERGA